MQMKAIQKAIEQGLLGIRIYAMIFSLVGETKPFHEHYLSGGIYTGFGSERFKLGPVKMMVDGSSTAPTCATLEPYASNPSDSGLLSMTPDEVEALILRGHLGGWQMATHTVGDRAVTVAVDAFEKVLKAHPKKNHRHRIEHCIMNTPELVKRIKKLGLIVTSQPGFVNEFGDSYLVNYGRERTDRMFACASYLKEGIIAGGGSDCPVTFSNPLLNIDVALNRTTQSGQVIGPQQKISLMEALRMYTYNSAYASFEEDIKGSLEVGKLADLVILDQKISDVPLTGIRDVKVDYTYIDGKEVYSRK